MIDIDDIVSEFSQFYDETDKQTDFDLCDMWWHGDIALEAKGFNNLYWRNFKHNTGDKSVFRPVLNRLFECSKLVGHLPFANSQTQAECFCGQERLPALLHTVICFL